jgi:hypothetical protein
MKQTADECLLTKASMAAGLGIKVNLCGTKADWKKW